MSESQNGEPASKEDYSREQIIELLQEVRERTGVRHPDNLGPDDPASKAFVTWCAQDNPYINILPPKAAEYSWDLDKTMAHFDAGYDNPDYLDELANDFLVQDLDNAEAIKGEEGMAVVLGQINDAIRRVKAKLQQLEQ